MAKLIKAATPIKEEIDTQKGLALYEETFWKFLVTAINAKAPVGDLGQILDGKELRKLVRGALEAKAETLTLEDAQFKLLHGAVKSYVPTLPPAIALELDGFLQALEDKTEKNPGGVEKVDLATKK